MIRNRARSFYTGFRTPPAETAAVSPGDHPDVGKWAGSRLTAASTVPRRPGLRACCQACPLRSRSGWPARSWRYARPVPAMSRSPRRCAPQILRPPGKTGAPASTRHGRNARSRGLGSFSTWWTAVAFAPSRSLAAKMESARGASPSPTQVGPVWRSHRRRGPARICVPDRFSARYARLRRNDCSHGGREFQDPVLVSCPLALEFSRTSRPAFPHGVRRTWWRP